MGKATLLLFFGLCSLFGTAAGSVDCIQYEFHPMDGSYAQRPISCPSYCVRYAVRIFVRQQPKFTFFLGNCDDADFCEKADGQEFNRTLSRGEYESLMDTELPKTVSQVQIRGNCCTTDDCNRME